MVSLKKCSLLFLFLLFLIESAQAAKTCQLRERFPVVHADSAKSVKNKLDVIWVIDDSSSMGNHQLNLKNNLESYFSVLETNGRVDYQMGVVTTGLRVVLEPSQQPLLLGAADDHSKRDLFMKSMMAGTEGSSSEKGSEAILRFFTVKPDFVRKGSHLSINILTDEDDESLVNQVELLRETLQFLIEQGNSVSINLISFESQTPNYLKNFSGFEVNSFPLSGTEFKRSILELAKKSIRSPVELLELKFDAEAITSVQLIRQGKASAFEQYQKVDSNTIRVDFNKMKNLRGAELEVQYRYACSSFDRSETKDLSGLISEIKFKPNSSSFLEEQDAHFIVRQVADFMNKHPDSRIELIGTSSFSLNPIAWLKMLPFEDHSIRRARNLAKARAFTIKTALMKMGIEEHRMEARGAFPGLHRHWYSYLMDLSCIDIIPLIDFAGMIDADRRVILKVTQGI